MVMRYTLSMKHMCSDWPYLNSIGLVTYLWIRTTPPVLQVLRKLQSSVSKVFLLRGFLHGKRINQSKKPPFDSLRKNATSETSKKSV